MRTAKLTLGFLVVAVSVILCLWATGLIGAEVAGATTRKAALVVGILGVAGAVLFTLLGARRANTDSARPPNSGPEF